jgi:hypothetical protein
VWDTIDSHHSTAHPLSLNLEVRELQRYNAAPRLNWAVRPHILAASRRWKDLIGGVASAEMRDWVRTHTGR